MDKKSFSHMGIDVRFLTLKIPTYKPGPVNPNPPLFGKNIHAIYPYTWQKSFTTEVENRIYDAILVRSCFIEVTILPDWGMHIYKVIDLTTGRGMFHCPKIMKPAHNAMRGAYVAGGVEMNFPIGHNAFTWSRVGVNVKKTNEGVQILFSSRDYRGGTRIAAGITVMSDFRGLCFDQFLYNPTPIPQPWYYWLNAGITPHKSLRFLFPTHTMLGHFEGSFMETVTPYPYPVKNNINYSINLEIPEPIGLFSPGSLQGWFGAYYDDWDFGIVRWAPPWQVAGQKFWSWGNSEEGLLWGRVASDQELPIPEIQSGRPETQMDRGIFRPYSVISHREWWMPVSEIGDVHSVTSNGALGIVQDDGKTSIRICPSRDVKEIQLQVNGKLTGDSFNLKAGKTYKRMIDIQKENINSVSVIESHGKLFSWSDEKERYAVNIDTLYDNPEPVVDMSAEKLFLRGFSYERTLRPALAQIFYAYALKKDPGFSRVHLRLGNLHLASGNYNEARKELMNTLQTDRMNDEALYLHGLASLWDGDVKQALADFTRTAATGETYVLPALIQLTFIALQDKDYLKAQLLVNSAMNIDPVNPLVLFLSCLVSRKTGKIKECLKACEKLDARLGVSTMAHWERSFAKKAAGSLYIRAHDETEDESLIEAALLYAGCGAKNETHLLLSHVSSPEGKTKAAYLARLMDKKSTLYRESVLFFAWGREMKSALSSSLEIDPDDHIACFSLGCLLAETGLMEEAIFYLKRAGRLIPENPLIRTTLGAVYMEAGEIFNAVDELSVAITLSPHNPHAWVLLDRALDRTETRDQAWLMKFSSASPEVLNNEEARKSLAQLMSDLGEFDRASALLSSLTFHPYELSHDLRNLWSETHRKKAISQSLDGKFLDATESIVLALEYPENLQLGKPFRSFDAQSLYTAGCILNRAGNKKEAENYFKQAVDEDQPDPTTAKPWSILAMIRLGKGDDAFMQLQELQTRAVCYLEASFQPDLDGDLRKIIDMCSRINDGWLPDIEELAEKA